MSDPVTRDGVALKEGATVWYLESDGTLDERTYKSPATAGSICVAAKRVMGISDNGAVMHLSSVYGNFSTAVAEMSDRLEAEEVRCRLARRELSNKLRAHESERNEE